MQALYATTRDDLGSTGLPPPVLASLLDRQFAAQEADYARQYPGGHRIIELDGSPVGRVWTARDRSGITLVDMAVLPEQRGSGIGSLILDEILGDADREHLRVRARTLRTNARAATLLLGLGFSVVATDELFVVLERPPSSPS